jgi:hypothetical protein
MGDAVNGVTRDVGLSQRQRYDSLVCISVWNEEQARIEDCELGAVRGMLLLAEGRLVDSGKGDVGPGSSRAVVCGICQIQWMNGCVCSCGCGPQIWHDSTLKSSHATVAQPKETE